MLLKFIMDRLCGHTAPYPNESSMEGLRAYGPSFGGIQAQNTPKTCLFYCRISSLI